MAGSYMDPPEERLAWDRDGSVLSTITSGGVVKAQSLAIRQAMNSESEALSNFSEQILHVAVVFPLPMDMKAVFFAPEVATTAHTISTSKNTTNGLDGTWTQQAIHVVSPAQVKPNYRMDTYVKLLDPTSVSTGVKGVRLTIEQATVSAMKAFHLYGYPSATATRDRLALWHPTTNNRLPAGWFDWGNTPRSSSADRTFRIKNLSADLTANDIDIYIEALTPGNPSVAGMHTISPDGVTYQAALNLPALAPGATSPLLHLRRTVPANAQVSVWSARLAADVDHWS